ncbi:MAG TPA: PulJ/GspJ family protein [Candidatus Hypogeohydataceae bacterium YC41]
MSGYKTRSVDGFTLLELLVALTIGVALVVASGTIIKSSVDLMARGERWLQGDFRETAALEFWREQVSAIRVTDSTNLLFVGKKEGLNFATPVVLNIRGKGFLVEAHYSVYKDEGNKYSLIYEEKRITPPGLAQKKEKGDSEGLVFLKGYDGISFEYLGEEVENNPWKAEWTDVGKIPRALKLTLIQGKEQKTLIAPIVATSFSSSSGQ